MSSQNYKIKTMTRDELNIAVDWAAAEGWNPGLYDADAFHAADPGGFLIGTLDDEPVATLSAVKYGETYGFLGFYIVKPLFRGKGYGIRIWKAGLKYLEGRNIGLDGVLSQQENYKKSGFKPAFRNIRYEGITGGKAPEHDGITDISALAFEDVAAYDRELFPAERSAFLKSWLSLPESNALGILQDGKFAGYGVIRKCRIGYKIGPLMAETPELADTLFTALKAGVAPSETVYLDVPEINPEALALAKSHGMTMVFETARMYTSEVPVLPSERLFGVTSFELG